MRSVTGRFGRLTRKASDDLHQHLTDLEPRLERDLQSCRILRDITGLPIADQPTINGLTPEVRSFLEVQLVGISAAEDSMSERAQRSRIVTEQSYGRLGGVSAIYIAARFSRRHEANALAQELKARGHTITSRWVLPDCDHVLPTGMSAQAADSERQRFAAEDIEDLLASDCLVSLQEEPRGNGRGGRHVEFGFALALHYMRFRLPSMEIVTIGPRETVFHHLPTVQHFNSVDAFLSAASRVRHSGAAA